jgi:orotidine-5'-phosphate decarboxylase
MENSSKRSRSNIILALDLVEENEPSCLLSRSIKILESTHPYLCALKLNRQAVLPLGLFDGVQIIVNKAHDIGLPTIMDAKINDIGSTNRAIARYYYKAGFDAVTVSPFIGWKEGLQPVFEVAEQMERGVLVLVYMSHEGASEGYGQIVRNPKTGNLQSQYVIFAKKALEWKADGVIVGATQPNKIREVYALLKHNMPIYSPGIGAQGGHIRATVKAGARYLIVGRKIFQKEHPAEEAKHIRDTVQKLLEY